MNQLEQSPMRRILGNLGLLVRGRVIAALLTLATTTIIARSLGLAEFGLVVVIQTYVLLVRGLLNFKQFEAIIKFGVPAHDSGDNHRLRRLLFISRKVDRYMSITATAAAIALAPLIGPSLGMNSDHIIVLAMYSLVLITTGNRTDVGILRLLDRFDILGWQVTIGAVVRFIGVLVACFFDPSIHTYVAILALAFICEELYVSWHGRKEFKNRIGYATNNEKIEDAKMSEFTGLRPFLWITYWQSNLDLVPKHVSVMIAGYLLGASEAGLLRYARQFSSLLAKPAVLIRQVVFLDLTRSWNQGGENFKLIAYRTAFYGGCVGMIFVLAGYFFGDNLLNSIAGKEYVAAAPVLTLLLLSATFELSASSLRSAAYAIGDADKVLQTYAVSALVYLSLFVLLTLKMGLIGAGWSAVASATIPLIAMVAFIKKGRISKSHEKKQAN